MTTIDSGREQQQAEEKVRGLEAANRTKDRFLAAMSHELRSPLNAIIGFTGTLLMRLPGPLTADQESQLRMVQSSGEHLLALINDLLDLARIEMGNTPIEPELVTAQVMIDEAMASLRPTADAKGLAFEKGGLLEPIQFHTDRRALSQILFNLAGNAVKFTQKGLVRLSVDRRLADGASILLFSVSDTGVGIREQDRERLFQPFAQLETTAAQRHEGRGLGLHLSQKLAELLGGRIELSTEVGIGSTFTLVLPEQ